MHLSRYVANLLLGRLCFLLLISLENDTLARIGTSCLQQLLENNVKKLSPSRWEHVTTTFVRLFRTTTPYQLFDESLRVEVDTSVEAAESSSGTSTLVLIWPSSLLHIDVRTKWNYTTCATLPNQ